MTHINFFAATDIVVVGQDSEYADMSNPQGFIYGSAGKVIAEDEIGNRKYIVVKTDRQDEVALEAAQKVADALNTRYARGMLPVAFSTWQDHRPAYGSVAYQDYGAATDIALERMEEDYNNYA